MLPSFRPLIVLSLIALAACQTEPDPLVGAEVPESPVGTTSDAPPQTVRPSPAPPPEPIAIQTQPGPDGTQVDLRRAFITGDILTVEASYRGDASHYISLGSVSVIDEATAQRYDVLQDDQDRYMVSSETFQGRVLVSPDPDEPAIVWFKFPAPPPTSETISVNLPEVGAFAGIPITR